MEMKELNYITKNRKCKSKYRNISWIYWKSGKISWNNILLYCSIKRYEYNHNIVVNNEELQRGGASYNWTKEASDATKEITKKENASKVEIPILLFQAGKDTYVNSEGQNKFAEGSKNCKIIKVENSRHEIYLEKDEIQKPYLEEVL